ncbi:MAG TPA: DUF2520 domain-containing protein [Actinomycetes bacterium]|nr:DUF2520 domain-containing protein [Actinomycetes bacterium]
MADAAPVQLSPAAVIGAGRVGLALGTFLRRIGVDVTVGVRSDRGRERAKDLGLAAASAHEAADGARLVILAVQDDELPALVTSLAAEGAFAEGQLVMHTAGVDGPALLAPAAAAGARIVACHPVQIFNDDLEGTIGRLPGTVWGVTGDPVGREVVMALGGRPMDVPESGRVRYHAALVLAANGTAALAATAADILRAGGVIDPAALLSGLIHAGVDSALATGQAGMSGPWVRGDGRTVAMHTESLARKQKVINVYAAVARLVADRAAAAGRLDPEARRRVEAALRGEGDGHGDNEESRERLELLRRVARRARGHNQR